MGLIAGHLSNPCILRKLSTVDILIFAAIVPPDSCAVTAVEINDDPLKLKDTRCFPDREGVAVSASPDCFFHT